MTISKIIHQTAPKNKDKWHPIWEQCQQSWKYNFTEFEYMFWNDDDLLNLIKTDFPNYFQLYTDFGENVILKVDFARYAILYKYGGIYADMDFMCKKNFYKKLGNNICIVESPSSKEIIQNSLMMSPPNDKRWLNVLENCKNYYYDFIKQNPTTKITGKYVIDITGPRLLSRSLDVSKIIILSKNLYNPNKSNFNSKEIYTKHYGTGKWGPCAGIRDFSNLQDNDINIYSSIKNDIEGCLILECGSSKLRKQNIPIPIPLSNTILTLCKNKYNDTFKITYDSNRSINMERTDLRNGWGYNHSISIQSNTLTNFKTENNSFTYDINSLKVYDINSPLSRVGKDGDGGYCVYLQDNYDILISGGISYDTSFEEQFLKKYNIKCEAFDGSVSKLPKPNNKISFNKLYIGDINNDNYTNLHDLIDKHNNIFLKMDIEGGEFPFFHSLNSNHMNKLKQIVLEIHFPTTPHRWEILDKLAETHYLIHIHGNNFQKKIAIKDIEKNNLKIKVGSSTTHTKTIELSSKIPNYTVLTKHNHNNSSHEFNFKIQDNNLMVERIDKKIGWNYDLYVNVNTHYINKTNSNIQIPLVFECTYVRKSDFDFEPELNTLAFPKTIDMANDASRKDVILNYFPFVNK
jgi:mannosyltransferase OCH1-like enzyme